MCVNVRVLLGEFARLHRMNVCVPVHQCMRNPVQTGLASYQTVAIYQTVRLTERKNDFEVRQLGAVFMCML